MHYHLAVFSSLPVHQLEPTFVIGSEGWRYFVTSVVAVTRPVMSAYSFKPYVTTEPGMSV
jgi:hypothetical protein